MRLHLFWIDKKWKERGYANNYNLIIDIEKKVYMVYTNSYYDYNKEYDIEVKKKSDIVEYVEYLKKHGFVEVKEF